MSVKLTEEELKELQFRYEDFMNVKVELGTVSQKIKVLGQRKERLHSNFNIKEESFESYRDEIVEKYKDEVGADFNIDIRTGDLVKHGQD
jgi:hypothetical protein